MTSQRPVPTETPPEPTVSTVGPDLLATILKRQLQLQRESFEIDPIKMRSDMFAKERAEYVQAMALALTVEVGEALQEVSWKPWATGVWFNRRAYIMELIDVLHFWTNLMLVATDNPREILEMYLHKADINAARQAGGYTGEKCPTCGRGHDDGSTEG